MAIEIKLPPVLEIIRGNILKHGNPLAMKGSEVAAWAKGLKLPEHGEMLFYTGGEYQLLPFIDSLVNTMTIMDQGSKVFSFMMGARNIINKTGINAEKLYASVLAKDRERFNSISYKAAVILQKLGYDFCYSGDKELYSGALLTELGFNIDMQTYALKVTKVIRESRAKTIVCLSPHAAEVLKFVYPKLVQDFDYEIKTFVELVWEKKNILPKLDSVKTVVIHDSCRLAREMEITEELRDILSSMGVSFQEAGSNRQWTTCCGGPNKFLYPEISHTIAARRVKELEETGADIILTSCPYCLASLQGGQAKDDNTVVEDLIEYLYRGFNS
ncbi:(Fe-S)-binding protein [Desulfosporosinus sp. SB140]|uniref:(Fe-S)-binding protein n=1 Tax=Desulfosporosinus paludis TaxID=3115649 RepID=UPI00388FB2C2